MNSIQVWQSIDYDVVSDLYNRRYEIHQRLSDLIQRNDISGYVDLALGITEPGGNYSAAEHGLGPIIIQQANHERVFKLAEKLFVCNDPTKILNIVYQENIPYLKVSVGSEMAALLKPNLFWVVNARTIWAHFVIKTNNVDYANEILREYHQEMPSDMEYYKWQDIFPQIGPNMNILASLGNKIALENTIQPGAVTFLWADAIANTAYNKYSK